MIVRLHRPVITRELVAALTDDGHSVQAPATWTQRSAVAGSTQWPIHGWQQYLQAAAAEHAPLASFTVRAAPADAPIASATWASIAATAVHACSWDTVPWIAVRTAPDCLVVVARTSRSPDPARLVEVIRPLHHLYGLTPPAPSTTVVAEAGRALDTWRAPLPGTGSTPDAPPLSFRDQWIDTVSDRHSPRGWASITDAARAADHALTDESGRVVQRGGERWCRAAVTALRDPATHTGTDHLPNLLPARCFADADLLRAWLNVPVGFEAGRTVADGLDLVDWRVASHEAIHRAVASLLEQAQDCGIYGAADHRIEVHRLVDSDDWHAGYLLVARADSGVGLATVELGDDDLIPGHDPSPERAPSPSWNPPPG